MRKNRKLKANLMHAEKSMKYEILICFRRISLGAFLIRCLQKAVRTMNYTHESKL